MIFPTMRLPVSSLLEPVPMPYLSGVGLAGVGVEVVGFVGSPGRTRTSDPAVNSRLLYQLSYRGAERACLAQLVGS